MIPGTTYNYSALAQRLLSGERNEQANLAKGFIAGLIGGLVGTGLKSIAERYFPPRDVAADSPPAIIANKAAEALLGEPLGEEQKKLSEQGLHWMFGGLVGGAYGAAVEIIPELSDGLGLPFGTMVFGIMHEGVLPAAGSSAPLCKDQA